MVPEDPAFSLQFPALPGQMHLCYPKAVLCLVIAGLCFTPHYL